MLFLGKGGKFRNRPGGKNTALFTSSIYLYIHKRQNDRGCSRFTRFTSRYTLQNIYIRNQQDKSKLFVLLLHSSDALNLNFLPLTELANIGHLQNFAYSVPMFVTSQRVSVALFIWSSNTKNISCCSALMTCGMQLSRSQVEETRAKPDAPASIKYAKAKRDRTRH